MKVKKGTGMGLKILTRAMRKMVMPLCEMGKTSEEARLFLIVFVFKDGRRIKSSPSGAFFKTLCSA